MGVSISTTAGMVSGEAAWLAPVTRSATDAAALVRLLANFITTTVPLCATRRPGDALDPEQPARVGLQHLWPDLIADLELGEIGKPPVRRDHGPIRAEQHLILQNRIDVAHQDRREIFWRPAGEIDVDVRLVGCDRQRLPCQGNEGCARMIFRSGKSAATSSMY